MSKRVLPRVVLALGVASCQAGGPPPFRAMGHVARVVVASNRGDTLAIITDSARIQALVAFVNARREGWEVPWAGVPVPRVIATFYRTAEANSAAHSFGAGSGFFEATSQPGDFASRAASRAELSQFLELVGAPANALDPADDRHRDQSPNDRRS